MSDMTFALPIHTALMFGLPLIVGYLAGKLGARRGAAWYEHAARLLAVVFVSAFFQYAGLYFATPWWLENGQGVSEPTIRLTSLFTGLTYFLVAGIIIAPPALGGYLVGYFRARDRAAKPNILMTFPSPPSDAPLSGDFEKVKV